MQISYTGKYFGDDTENKEDLNWWIYRNLDGGIEHSLKVAKAILPLLLEDYLVRHPDDVQQIAQILGCSGRDHEILPDAI
jgi:hypothetical protein